jgi:hypothetical protein
LQQRSRPVPKVTMVWGIVGSRIALVNDAMMQWCQLALRKSRVMMRTNDHR